ncbi:ABC transporter ATP-binding protein [Arcobacter sp. KX21116]|jgi:zinc transport system ATP-binding protein|uniref:metal ABC transporter ATP-binding protein n=1 Tax=Arcobacter TaxID=28196 RepID=UPI0035D3EBDD|tara:strand:- start:37590 stop:38348 length:759 start_codon:yes stop_codon:yes gene_type:complete
MNILEIDKLSFSYDKQVILEDISLTIKENDFLAIIGPNGGGKSTLLKAILGINKVKKGKIRFLGSKVEKNISTIGYVPQNTNVNVNFPIKVIEVVMMGHVGHKRPLLGYKKEEIACAMGALEQVSMQDFANVKIGTLSGGQRQRVMIARALCAHPKILLLDEPTASIDVDGQKQIYDLLKLLNKSITIVVVSHDISVILGYASKVAHINKKLTFHDISNRKSDIPNADNHFCEVEMLQLLGTNVGTKKSCGC